MLLAPAGQMRSQAIPSVQGLAAGQLAKQIDTTLAKVRGEYDQVLEAGVGKSSRFSIKHSKLMIRGSTTAAAAKDAMPPQTENPTTPMLAQFHSLSNLVIPIKLQQQSLPDICKEHCLLSLQSQYNKDAC